MPRAAPLLTLFGLSCCGPADDSSTDSPIGDSEQLPTPTACSIQLTDSGSTAPPSWELERDDGTRAPDSLSAEISWYGGLVTITVNPAVSLEHGLLPFIPHVITDHDLQQAVLDRGDELTALVRLSASWDDGPSCDDAAEVPFRTWEPAINTQLATGQAFDPSQLNEERSQQLADTFGLVVIVQDSFAGDYDHEIYLVTPATGDALQRYTIDRELMEATATGAFDGSAFASADIHQGQITLMSEGTPYLAKSQLFRYQVATGELLHAYDTSGYSGGDDVIYAHNRMFVDPEDPNLIHTMLWRRRDPDAPPGDEYVSPGVRMHLDDDLTISAIEDWVDPTRISLNAELYGNSTTLSSPGHDGSRYQCTTFPASFSASGPPEDTSPFIVAGLLSSSRPGFVFVREGYADIALRSDVAETYPDIRVIQVPDTDGAPTMDFLHGASLTALDADTYELWVLSLHRAGEARAYRFLLDATSGTLTPTCSYQAQRDPTSYSNLITLPQPDLVGLFWGGSANVEWLDRQSCTLLGKQFQEAKKPGERAKPRWMEVVDSQDFLDDTHIAGLELRYDLGKGVGLYSEL